MAAKQDDLSIAHLDWLVRNRSENQKASLRLFQLFKKYPKELRTGKSALIGQALVSVSFSLWRAVFLADKTGAMGKSLEDAEIFLGKLILDNAVAYPQDRTAREWTFNYYVSNANYRLKQLSKQWPEILVPAPSKKTPKNRWAYNQMMLMHAVDRFTVFLERGGKSEKKSQLRRI